MSQPTNFAHITANGTTTITGNDVFLWSVTVNKLGAAANTATITDTASGVVIAVIDTTALVGPLQLFGLHCPRGFTVVVATGTAGDITVVYG